MSTPGLHRTHHAHHLPRHLPLRRRPLRSRPRPDAADLPLQLQHLPAHAVLGGGGARDGFRLLTGQSELTKSLFNTRKNEHWFCRHCGVRAFGVGTETPIGRMVGVNLGCLTDVSDEALSRLPITGVDGLHDRWQDAPAFFAHL